MKLADDHPRHGPLRSRYELDAEGYILTRVTVPAEATADARRASYEWHPAYDMEDEDWIVADTPQYRLESGVPVKRRSTSAANPIEDLERRVAALEGGH
jgi:hypothetical protein